VRQADRRARARCAVLVPGRGRSVLTSLIPNMLRRLAYTLRAQRVSTVQRPSPSGQATWPDVPVTRTRDRVGQEEAMTATRLGPRRRILGRS
jgi:hypothetical protein